MGKKSKKGGKKVQSASDASASVAAPRSQAAQAATNVSVDAQNPAPTGKSEASEPAPEVQIPLLSIKVNLPENSAAPENTITISLPPQDPFQALLDTLAVHPETAHYTEMAITNLQGESIPSDTPLESLKPAEVRVNLPKLTPVVLRSHVRHFREAAGLRTTLTPQAPASLSYLGAETPASELKPPFVEPELDLYPLPPTPNAPAPLVKSVSFSPWPVTLKYRAKGHVAYLVIQTLETETVHITGSTRGFYVSNSSNTRFDPSIKHDKLSLKRLLHMKNKVFPSLHDLLCVISPLYLETRARNIELLAQSHPVAHVIPQGIVQPFWLTSSNVRPDLGLTQAGVLFGGTDCGDLQKLWNDEYQDYLDIPKGALGESIMRERMLIRAGVDFVQAARDGAIEILSGGAVPIDENVDPIDRIYLRGGIFYSFATDASGVYSTTGGIEAARYCAKKDLEAARRFGRLDDPCVRVAMTTVIDYAGRRLVCQAPVPGAFYRNAKLTEADFKADGTVSEAYFEKSNDIVVYGVGDDVEHVSTSPVFEKALKGIADGFHLKKHSVFKGGEKKELITSLDVKGLQAADNRFYAIELAHMTPVDVYFMENFPQYPHKEVLLRHELVDEWFKREMVKKVREHEDDLKANTPENGAADGETAEKGASDEKKKPQQEYLAELGKDFDSIRFNPDAFNPRNQPATDISAEELAKLKEEEAVVRGMGDLLRDEVIPRYIREVAKGIRVAPLDGAHLREQLHANGINMRYLGLLAKQAREQYKSYKAELEDQRKDAAAKKAERIAKKAEKKEEQKEASEEKKEAEEKPQPESIDTTALALPFYTTYRVIVQDIIARSAKHVLRYRTGASNQELDLEDLPAAIIGFLNELFSDKANKTHEEVCATSLERFQFELDASSLISFVNANRTPVLREICVKYGLRLANKNYSTSFSAEDIEEITPVVESAIYELHVAEELLANARAVIKESDGAEDGAKLRKDALQSFLTGIQVLEQAHGKIHSLVAAAYLGLAEVFSELGQFSQAAELLRTAAVIWERLYGYDLHRFVVELLSLAYLENLAGRAAEAVRLYNRILVILRAKTSSEAPAKTAVDPWTRSTHPFVLTVLSNFGWVYQNSGMLNEAVELVQQAISVLRTTDAESNLAGVMERRLAVLQLELKKYSEGKAAIDRGITILGKNLGEGEILEQMEEWLEGLERFLSK